MSRILYEVCVEDVAGAVAAQAGGADRVELCARLEVGGTTASLDALTEARAALEIPLVALVRSRAGGFVYSDAELDTMGAEIEAIKAAGLWGVALGALRADAAIDVDATRRLVELARPLNITFHRAFDEVSDRRSALEALIELGVDRVLTSGGAPDAMAGRGSLAELVSQAGTRLAILAAGSIRTGNVREIVEATGVREVHGRAPDGAGGTSASEVRAFARELARPETS